jgi:hypothetical protein
MSLCFSLQLRRPTKKSQGNVTQETVFYLMFTPYNLCIVLFFFTFLQSQTFPFWPQCVKGRGFFSLNIYMYVKCAK